MSRAVPAWLTVCGLACLAAGAGADRSPRLLWNATASVPRGLYAIEPVRAPRVGELVVVMPPLPLARALVERGIVGDGVPLIKTVAGVAGQHLCRHGSTIAIDGSVLGEALVRDRHGRGLPVWQGCRVLADDEIFLMNPDMPASLDGRYFGALPTRSVIGRARPLWNVPADRQRPDSQHP